MGESSNINKYMELEEGEISDKDFGDFEDLEMEEGASISVEF